MEKQTTLTKQECYTEEEIMREIAPVLKDYFVARFRNTKYGLLMKLPNGQKFNVSVMKA